MKRTALLLVAMVLALACGNDEQSSQPLHPGGVLPPPTGIQAFEAMRAGLGSESAALYTRHLSTDFVFSPTPEDSLRGEFAGTGVFDHWTKPVESSTLVPLFNAARRMNVRFVPSVEINQNTFVRYRVAYQLELTDESGAAREYRGVARLDIVNELGQWRIIRWDETENVDGYESWGYLRGTLRPRIVRPGKA